VLSQVLIRIIHEAAAAHSLTNNQGNGVARDKLAAGDADLCLVDM
jgi:hypothetical protein